MRPWLSTVPALRRRPDPDPTFYRTPEDAAAAPAEELAYVAAFHRDGPPRPDALAVIDVKRGSADYSKVVGWLDMPETGDELHHFGWNACSSPSATPVTTRATSSAGISSCPGSDRRRINVVDTKPDPRQPHLVKTIEAGELAEKAGYSRPHTLHCGPSGLYLSALGGAGEEGPGGIAVLDHETFEPLEQWELDRGPQCLAYDFWWHLNDGVLISSEWAHALDDRGRGRARAPPRA